MHQKRIVAILMVAAFISILNQTLLMIAMPPIMRDFQIDANQAQWLTTIYLLTNGILIPITAFLIGRFSNKSLLISAVTLFSIGTILGALSPSYSMLLVARVIQAAGAGIIMPLMQTVILTLYPREKRGAIMGITGLVTGFAPAIGPTLAGWLIEQFSWRALFYTMIPVSLIVLLAVIFMMKDITERQSGRFDLPSVIYSSIGWGSLLYGFSMAGSLGFTHPTTLISLVVGAIALTVFIRKQLRMPQPILEFRVFTSVLFTVATLLSTIVYALMIGSQVLLTFYVQNVRQFSALDAGLMLLPGALAMGLFSPRAGKIFDKYGGEKLALIGFAFIFATNGYLLFLHDTTSIAMIAFIYCFASLGFAMIMMPLTTAGMNALPMKYMAHGTAVNSTLRMVAGAMITALLVTIMSMASQWSANASMLVGIRAAFGLATLLSLIGIILAIVYKRVATIGSFCKR